MNQSSDGTISPARSSRDSACSARESTSRRASSARGGSEGGSGLGMNAATVSPATVLLRVSPTALAIRSPLWSNPLPGRGESKACFPFGCRLHPDLIHAAVHSGTLGYPFVLTDSYATARLR